MAKKTKRSSMRDIMHKRAGERNVRGSDYLDMPSDMEWLKTKKGTMHLSLVPYRVSVDDHPDGIDKGDFWYRRLILIHRDVGPEGVSVLCPKTFDEKAECPICEKSAKLRKSRKDGDEDVAKALRAKERELFNVVDLDGDDDEVFLWDMSTFLFGELLKAEIRDDEEATFDLEGGSSIAVRFKEDSFDGRKFVKPNKITFEERNDIDEDFVDEHCADLDDILQVLSYKDLKKLLEGSGTNDDEDDDDDEDDPPKDKDKKSRRTKTKKDKDDDPEDPDDPDGGEVCKACEGTGKSSYGKTCRACEGSGEQGGTKDDPDDPDDDNDDESEKKGKKKSRRTKTKKDKEDEDDPDDDPDDDFDDNNSDDDEEEEKSKKSKKSRRTRRSK